MIFYIGNIPSKYYKVFGDHDMAGFREKTIMAILLIAAEAFVSFDGIFFSKDKIRQYTLIYLIRLLFKENIV